MALIWQNSERGLLLFARAWSETRPLLRVLRVAMQVDADGQATRAVFIVPERRVHCRQRPAGLGRRPGATSHHRLLREPGLCKCDYLTCKLWSMLDVQVEHFNMSHWNILKIPTNYTNRPSQNQFKIVLILDFFFFFFLIFQFYLQFLYSLS